MGDYAFMLRDYELALSNYRLLSTDYKLDKAWKRYAGVQVPMVLFSVLVNIFDNHIVCWLIELKSSYETEACLVDFLM